MASSGSALSAFQQDKFWARRKFLTFFGQKFYIFDSQDHLIAFVKQAAFKLKEDIRIYADEGMTQEILSIKARTILDWGAAYDVVDSTTGQKMGALKRRGWKSLVSDEWIVMDAVDSEFGRIKEDSVLMATIRRHVLAIIPQNFNFFVGDSIAGTAKQNWNFFNPKMHVDFGSDPMRRIDRRLALASIVLLMAIEGRQQ
jgi:hypothetical protein